MWTLVSNVGLVIEKGGQFKLVKRGDSKYLVKENFDVERLIGDHQVRDPRTKYNMDASTENTDSKFQTKRSMEP